MIATGKFESKGVIMATPTGTRREMHATMAVDQVVATMGVAGSATTHEAGEAQRLPTVMEVQKMHRRQLDARKVLDGESALSEAELSQSLGVLDKQELVSTQESEKLESLIAEIFKFEILETLFGEVNRIYNDAIGELDAVARTIAAILMESVAYANDYLQEVDYNTVTLIVAHDVRGAIDGAVTGAEIAGIGSSLNERVRLAVAGAIAGGASGSIIGYFDA